MPKSHAAKASRIFAAMQLRRSKTGGYFGGWDATGDEPPAPFCRGANTPPAGAADLAVKSR
jgi:hypothetical protein